MGPADVWNYVKWREYQKTVLIESEADAHSPGRLEEILFEKMRSLPPSSRGRFVFGNLYETICNFLWLWRIRTFVPVIFLILTLLALAYLPMNMVNFSYFGVVLAPVVLDLIPSHNVFLPLGRGERSYAVVVLGMVIGILFCLLAALMAAFSNFLVPVMPEIVWKGNLYQYHPMEIRQLALVPLFLPFSLIFGIRFQKFRWLCVVIIFASMPVMFDFLHIFASLNILALMSLIGLSWLSFVIYVRLYFLKHSIVFSR